MVCPNCGTNNLDSAVYCGECGALLAKRGSAGAPVTGYCSRCGSAVTAGTCFCENCGSPLVGNGADQSLAVPQALKSGKSHKRVLLALACAVWLLIVLAVDVLIVTLPDLIDGEATVGTSAVDGESDASEISDGGYSTAEQAAQTLEIPLNDIYANLTSVLANGANDKSIRAYATTFCDGFPPAVIDAIADEEGVTKDGLVEITAESMSSAVPFTESDLEYLDKLSISAAVKLTDQLDAGHLDEVNEVLDRCGLTERATDGYKVGETVTFRALDGSLSSDGNESESYDVSDTTIEVIQIADRWYLWSSALNQNSNS